MANSTKKRRVSDWPGVWHVLDTWRWLADRIEAVRDQLDRVSGRTWAFSAIAVLALTVGILLMSLVFQVRVYGVATASSWFVEPLTYTWRIVAVVAEWGDQKPVQDALSLSAFVGLVGAVLTTGLLIKGLGLAEPEPLHGKTSFGSFRDLKRGRLLDDGTSPGVVTGRWQKTPFPFMTQKEWTHVFVLGPTGCGKGQGLVLPNALMWPGSLIAFDLKGEAWDKTAGYRQAALGQRVFYFKPTDPDGRTCRYNPLAHIRISHKDDPLDVKRRNEVRLISELKKIAGMLMPIPETGDKFWAQSGQIGFLALGLVVATNVMYGLTKTLSIGAIYRELKRPDLQAAYRKIATAREWNMYSQEARLQCSAFAASTPEQTFGSVRQTIAGALELWDDPNVVAATEVSDFDMRAMRQQKVSVYLCASAGDLDKVRPLYRLIFQQFYDQLTAEEPAPDDHGVLVILDEFARLGRMKALQAAFALARSYKVRFLIVVQSLNQLKEDELYGRAGAEDIAINCDTHVYFTPQRVGDAKELSELLGYNTVMRKSRTRQSRGGSSTSEGEHRRAQMLPQEIMELPKNEVLVKARGLRTFRLRKIEAWQDETFKPRMAMRAPKVEPYCHEMAAAGAPSSSGQEEDVASLEERVKGLGLSAAATAETTVESANAYSFESLIANMPLAAAADRFPG